MVQAGMLPLAAEELTRMPQGTRCVLTAANLHYQEWRRARSLLGTPPLVCGLHVASVIRCGHMLPRDLALLRHTTWMCELTHHHWHAHPLDVNTKLGCSDAAHLVLLVLSTHHARVHGHLLLRLLSHQHCLL